MFGRLVIGEEFIEMAEISIVKANDSYQGTLKALAPLKKALGKKIGKIDGIVVKINFVTALRELATTPFPTVKAFVDFIKPFYFGKIIIAEEATIGQTWLGFRRFGFTQLAKENRQVELFNSVESKIEKVKIKYPHGELVLPLAKIYTQSPFIASICRAKTHDTVVVTLAIKNLLVGAIRGNRGKIHQGQDIHWILTEIAKHTFPDFALIDGVVGMEGNGPGSGTPINSGWIVASFDALAADSLAAQIMDFDLADIGYLNLLAKAGFGKLSPKPKFVTPFKPHQTFEQQKNWR